VYGKDVWSREALMGVDGDMAAGRGQKVEPIVGWQLS
jgi:hypothetical protein